MIILLHISDLYILLNNFYDTVCESRNGLSACLLPSFFNFHNYFWSLLIKTKNKNLHLLPLVNPQIVYCHSTNTSYQTSYFFVICLIANNFWATKNYFFAQKKRWKTQLFYKKKSKKRFFFQRLRYICVLEVEKIK